MRDLSKHLNHLFTFNFRLSLLFCMLLISSTILLWTSAVASSSYSPLNLASSLAQPNQLRATLARLKNVFQSVEAEQEPNETSAQANPIALPGHRTGTVKFGDAAMFEYLYSNGPKDKIEDFYQFTIPPGQTRRIDFVLTFNNPAADLDLFLFKEENNGLLALAISNGSSTTERITPILTLDPGNYLVGVSAFDDPGNTALASYTLNVTPDTAPPPPTITGTNPVSAIAGGGPISITVNGTNFIGGQSIVRLNGANRATTFISSTQLVASLTAADIATTGTALITVFNPTSLGGQSIPVNFLVLPPGSPELEVEPNESSQQANLLLMAGRRQGTIAVGDAAQVIIQTSSGPTDPIEDLFAVNLTQASRLDLQLNGTNTTANLGLYLMRESATPNQLEMIGNSRLSGPVQRVTTPAMLAPGRYLVGVSAITGSSDYIIGANTLGNVPGFEADVSPRPDGTGDGTVTIADWTQVGRFAAGLDTPTEGSEVQRADCAPKSSLGDGRLTIADWVMAGRYAAGLETPTPAGGPSTLVTSGGLSAGFEKLTASAEPTEAEQQQGRALRIVQETFQRGQENDLKIELVSQGNENAIGFSINFDLTQFNFVRASLGPDAAGAILNINTNRLAEGRLGVGIALPSGQVFAAGARLIVRVTFNLPATSSVNSTTVSFGDLPTVREMVDVNANVLPAAYTPGVIMLNPLISLTPTLTGLEPDTVFVGGPAFMLTVSGANFIDGAVVQVNGVARITEFVSSTQLRGAILPQDVVDTGTISITVQNPPPSGGLSNALNLLIINPMPAITSIDPSSAVIGGQAFTLNVTGTNFVPGTTVQFNGNNRVTTLVNSTQLTAQILASDIATAGAATVRVVNPLPGGGTSNTVEFTVSTPSPLPRITGLSPETVLAGGPAFTLTVNGSGFISSSVVRFNGNTLPTTFVNNTQLTAQVAAENIANAGTASITVFSPAPGGGTSNAALLTINLPPNPVPTLAALNPSTVTAGSPQLTLTLTGTNFVSNSVVRFNGQDRPTTFVSAVELSALISANDILNGGTASITVFNPAPAGGTSNALTLTINFAAPAITFLSPTSVVAGGPAFTLTVIGTNFAPGSAVRWNGQDRPTTIVSVTELTAQIPATDIVDVGSATITVFSPPPGGGLSNAVTFNITQAGRPIPRITTISPDNAIAGGAGFTLIVNGQNFVSDSVVRWNGSPRTTGFVSSTQLTAQIPASDIATAGTASVTVFTPPAGGGESNAVPFTINQAPNPVPSITSIAPGVVSAGGPSFVLTVNGANFVAGSVLQLNGSNRPTTVVNANQLTANIAAEDIAAAGTASIRVVNPAPGGGVSNEVTLTIINPVPVITSIGPNVVVEGSPAFTLTVNGTGFVVGAEVRVNGSPRLTTFVNGTQLTAQIPATDVAMAGTLNVQVVNPGPGGGTSNTATLEVRRPSPLPRITSISPETVNAGGPGFTLVVNGSGFVNGSIVRVNGQDRPTDFVSGIALAAQIPATDIAAGGLLTITVFTPAPGGGTSNPATLTINNPRPRITSLSPDTATAGSIGFTLIVNGEGFVPNSVVRFNGVDVMTQFVTITQLSALIPPAAITAGGVAPVVVFNPAPGGGTSNALNFSIINPASVITSLIPDQVLVGGPDFTLTVNGSGFVNGSIVRFNGQDRQTTFVNSGQLTAVITAADIATAGTATVAVFNPPPGGGLSNVVALAINNPAPALTSLSPSSVIVGSPALTLTINGIGFLQSSVVQVNGNSRQTTFVSSTQLTIQVAASEVATAGTASIAVVNPGPGGGTSNALIFTVSAEPNPVPTLANLSPGSIAAGSATFVLTVNGTNFIPGSVVQWNGSPRPTTFITSTQLTAQIPATDVANPGTVNITATNPAPGGGISNALVFAITPPNPVPVLESLSPNTAAAGIPGFVLTVNGTSFVPGAVVLWNGSPRATVFISGTQVTAEITAADVASAGTASVNVVNPAPGGGASNALTFSIVVQPNPVPSIGSLSPGSAFEGDPALELTVTGENFVAGSIVMWNGSPRPTVFITGTQLTAQISAADLAFAGTVIITVVNPAPGGGTSNTMPFTINPLSLNR